MSVVELVEFVKALEEKFGVSGAVGSPSSRQFTTTRWSPSSRRRKTTFDVVLTNVGQAKIQVIKVLREI